MRGQFTGTGAAIAVEVGFRPRKVELRNIGGNATAVWQYPMADASMQKTVDSGAGATDISTVTTGGVTPTATGFSLGTDADLNAAGENVVWEATE
jgi:hypothetical protein